MPHAVKRAKLLLTVSVETSALSFAAFTDTAKCPEVRTLQDSAKYLTEQMSTLIEKLQKQTFTAAVQPPTSVLVRCYNCNLSRNCRQPRRKPVCYSCNQPGHVARYCQHQGNDHFKGHRSFRSCLEAQEFITAVRVTQRWK